MKKIIISSLMFCGLVMAGSAGAQTWNAERSHLEQRANESRSEYEQRLRREGYTNQEIRSMEEARSSYGSPTNVRTESRWEGENTSESRAAYERRLRSEGYTNEQIRRMNDNGSAYMTPARREASKELNETRIEQQRKIDQAETKAANDLRRARNEGWSQSEINRVEREGQMNVQAAREEANRELNKSTSNWRNATYRY